jgi:hypothetical protein
VVAVGVTPDPQIGKGCVGSIDQAIAIAVVFGQLRKARALAVPPNSSLMLSILPLPFLSTARKPSPPEIQPEATALPLPNRSKLPPESARLTVWMPLPSRSMTIGVMPASRVRSFWPETSVKALVLVTLVVAWRHH